MKIKKDISVGTLITIASLIAIGGMWVEHQNNVDKIVDKTVDKLSLVAKQNYDHRIAVQSDIKLLSIEIKTLSKGITENKEAINELSEKLGKAENKLFTWMNSSKKNTDELTFSVKKQYQILSNAIKFLAEKYPNYRPPPEFLPN